MKRFLALVVAAKLVPVPILGRRRSRGRLPNLPASPAPRLTGLSMGESWEAMRWRDAPRPLQQALMACFYLACFFVALEVLAFVFRGGPIDL